MSVHDLKPYRSVLSSSETKSLHNNSANSQIIYVQAILYLNIFCNTQVWRMKFLKSSTQSDLIKVLKRDFI